MSWEILVKNCRRFLGDYIGLYGNYWYKDAHKEVQKMVDEYENGEMDIDEIGVARWKSNGNLVPYDRALMGYIGGVPLDPVACYEAYQVELDEFFKEYRKNWQPPSEEELAEMRSAFGEGEVVVDVISGRRIQL